MWQTLDEAEKGIRRLRKIEAGLKVNAKNDITTRERQDISEKYSCTEATSDTEANSEKIEQKTSRHTG